MKKWSYGFNLTAYNTISFRNCLSLSLSLHFQLSYILLYRSQVSHSLCFKENFYHITGLMTLEVWKVNYIEFQVPRCRLHHHLFINSLISLTNTLEYFQYDNPYEFRRERRELGMQESWILILLWPLEIDSIPCASVASIKQEELDRSCI